MEIGALLTMAGIKLGGWALSEIFGGDEPGLASLQTGAMRSRYAASLQDISGGRRGEALSVARRESARSGTALGGAYLENVVQIEQQINDIIGREISQYEMQLMGAELDWESKRREVAYAGQVQRKASRQAAIGDIFGTVAAYPLLKEQKNLRKTRWEEIKTLLFPMEGEEKNEDKELSAGDLFNRWMMATEILKSGVGIDTKEWEKGIGEIEQRMGGQIFLPGWED